VEACIASSSVSRWHAAFSAKRVLMALDKQSNYNCFGLTVFRMAGKAQGLAFSPSPRATSLLRMMNDDTPSTFHYWNTHLCFQPARQRAAGMLVQKVNLEPQETSNQSQMVGLGCRPLHSNCLHPNNFRTSSLSALFRRYLW